MSKTPYTRTRASLYQRSNPILTARRRFADYVCRSLCAGNTRFRLNSRERLSALYDVFAHVLYFGFTQSGAAVRVCIPGLNAAMIMGRPTVLVTTSFALHDADASDLKVLFCDSLPKRISARTAGSRPPAAP